MRSTKLALPFFVPNLFASSFCQQPQLLVIPHVSLLPRTDTIEPQLHLHHHHIALMCPDEMYKPSALVTNNRPNLRPVKSFM
jgi:hypothetical protein